MIKIIASDMDGSLLDDKKELPKNFFEVLQQLNEKGVAFVVASGRSYVTLKKTFGTVLNKMDFICDNGAFVVENDKVTNIDIIPKDALHHIIKSCGTISNIELILCGVNGTYHRDTVPVSETEISNYYINHKAVQNLLDVDDDIFKIAIYDPIGPQKNSYRILSDIYEKDFALQISGSNWMDIMNLGVSKGVALQKIQHNMGVTKAETMAFGDFYNDIELLKQAEYSFVMANANHDMKQYGNYQAKSNNENGVLDAIQQYVFNK